MIYLHIVIYSDRYTVVGKKLYIKCQILLNWIVKLAREECVCVCVRKGEANQCLTRYFV